MDPLLALRGRLQETRKSFPRRHTQVTVRRRELAAYRLLTGMKVHLLLENSYIRDVAKRALGELSIHLLMIM